MVVCLSIQNELNRLYAATIDLSKLSITEIQTEADRYKKCGSMDLALKYYEYILSRCELRTAAYILPRITSCYRQQGRARDAIRAFADAKKKYGTEFLSPVLLTSVAAAYCDLEEYENARKCCDIALARGGRSEELKNVYKRINAGTRK